MADEKMSVATLKGGAVIEQVDEAIQRVLENVVDPNTKAKQTRTVTLKLTIAPDEERELLGISATVQTKMAPPVEVIGRAWIAQTRDGIVAMEHDPKQPNLYDDEQTADVTPLRAVNDGGDE
jgi:hypothetical protein